VNLWALEHLFSAPNLVSRENILSEIFEAVSVHPILFLEKEIKAEILLGKKE
jgi:hypothetical protein